MVGSGCFSCGAQCCGSSCSMSCGCCGGTQSTNYDYISARPDI